MFSSWKEALVPVKQSWRIRVNDSHKSIEKYNMTKTKQSITKPCAYSMVYTLHRLNSLQPSDATEWHRSESPLAYIMACCLTAQIHNLNLWWHIISEALWHSPERNFTVSDQATFLYKSLKIILLKLLPNLAGTNELSNPDLPFMAWITKRIACIRHLNRAHTVPPQT